MNARAPNLPSLGAHVVEKKNSPASWEKIGHASLVVEMAIRTRIARTDRPERSAMTPKLRSPIRRRPESLGAPPGGAWAGVATAVMFLPRGSDARPPRSTRTTGHRDRGYRLRRRS